MVNVKDAIIEKLSTIITPAQIANMRYLKQLKKSVEQERKNYEPIVKELMSVHNIKDFLVKDGDGAKVTYVEAYTRQSIDEKLLREALAKINIDITALGDIYKTTEVSDCIKITL